MGVRCGIAAAVLVGGVSPFLLVAGIAEPTARADEATILQGIQLRKEHRDREAMVLFQKAVAEDPTARALAQLGLCEHSLGLWVEAEKDLLAALAKPKDAWIAKNEATLRADLARIETKVGSIEIWGGPVAATVSIDGHPAGQFPLAAPVRVIVGKHLIVVEASGFLPDSRSVDVAPRAITREHFALGSLPARMATTPERAAPDINIHPHPSDVATENAPAGEVRAGAQAGDAVGMAGEPATKEAPAGSAPVYRKWWFWTAVGAVVVAGTVTAFALARSKDSCPAGAVCTSW
jgi:hypothetical protein